MENKIESLIAQLDESTLRLLPCFYDEPLETGFRLGLNKGPQIKFWKEFDDNYSLQFTNIKEGTKKWPIDLGSENFEGLIGISSIVKKLCDIDDNYNTDDSKMLEAMLGNLDRIIKTHF